MRDEKNMRRLQEMGWRVFVVWECQMSDKRELNKNICRFLEN